MSVPEAIKLSHVPENVTDDAKKLNNKWFCCDGSQYIPSYENTAPSAQKFNIYIYI